MQYLTIWDLVLTPLYLIILVYIARRHRDKKYPVKHPLHKYYLPGLYVKFGGVIFIALIYQYYYGGGDTYNFFTHSKIINSALDDSFTKWIQLLVRTSPDVNPQLYPYVTQLEWYTDASSYTVAAIASVLGVFTGNTYLPIALLFAFISYTGIWAMFKTFVNIYPHLTKQLAIAFLFVPSTIVWGSALFKDTVCMFGLGWLTYTTFRIFVDRNFSVKNILILMVSFYLVAVIKMYVLLAFIPALIFWLLMTYSKKIKIVAIRWIVNIFFVGMTMFGFLYFSKRFAAELNRYSLEKLIQTAETTREWITYSSGEEGSAYNLGEIDATAQGILAKFPAAVNVTLYRPYLWEVKKPIMALSALESFAFLVLTIMVFYKCGILNTFRYILKDRNLLFFFTYAILFAFAVGISTGNFGTLSRYKIPCLPFFAALLLILYYQSSFAIKGNSNVIYRKRTVRYIS